MVDLADSPVLSQPPGLEVVPQPGGWTSVRRSGEVTGIALGPVVSALWSAAGGCTAVEAARTAGVSSYLAACAVNALRRGGLLLPERPAGYTEASRPRVQASDRISVLIIHRRAGVGVDTCLNSVLGQADCRPVDIGIVASAPVSTPTRGVLVWDCEAPSLGHALVEQMVAARGQAILLLDSRCVLAPGALPEMLYALRLRGDIAAIAPRAMWRSWPGLVAAVGDWRIASDVRRNPYAGQMDVGQFRSRWQQVPAVSFTNGLVRATTLQAVGAPDPDHGLEWMGADWCYRARLRGHLMLAATRAIASGPWPAPVDLAQETYDKLRFVRQNFEPDSARCQVRSYRREDELRPAAEQDAVRQGWVAFRRRHVRFRATEKAPGVGEQRDDLAPRGPGPMLHEGAPVLTADIVRSLSSKYDAISPRRIRRRIVFAGLDTFRHRSMARELGSACELLQAPHEEGEASLRELCESADGVIAAAQFVHQFGFLQDAQRPILVDMQPPVGTALPWLRNVDGVVCASEEERLYWLGQLAGLERLNVHTGQATAGFRDLVIVAPGQFELPAPPLRPVLKGVHPHVRREDQVVLWCSGLLASDDPVAAVRAFAILQAAAEDDPEAARRVKLVFAIFDDEATDPDCLKQAMALAAECELASVVLFEAHVLAAQRSSYLCEADLGVLLCQDAVDAQLRERAGMAACIAAELPLVVTAGCAGSGWVQRYGLGRAVPPTDHISVARAVTELLQTPRSAYGDRFAAAARARPQIPARLTRFCRRPELALDRQVRLSLRPELVSTSPSPTVAWELPRKLWRALRTQGLRSATRQVAQYARWLAVK